jgi:EAL domain-containing protein (putative c-di-GMP-specific phosphodiesterase class I)
MSALMERIIEPLSKDPLSRILALESIATQFQPIVSVKRKSLIGVEALARATDPADDKAVSPVQLFKWAREAGRLLELDQVCQANAMRHFSGLPVRDPELLMFMNVEASLLDANPALSLLAAAQKAGVKPQNIVIEVNETEVLDQSVLIAFVQRHREQGFLIAMDDLGSGHSGLQRWPLLKPDIIKLDRSLVDGVAGNFFAQELLRSLIALGRQTGALILAEGVETQADVTTCLELGVDLFQGYFFARPAGAPYANLDQALDVAQTCAGRHKDRTLERMAQRRADYQKQSFLARGLAFSLMQGPVEDFDAVLKFMPPNGQLESLVILDDRGIQCSHAIFPGDERPQGRASLFQPSRPGTDHSDRDYFYGLTEAGHGRDFFLTEPHLSLATGELCRTLSHVFQHPSGASFVACLDLKAE